MEIIKVGQKQSKLLAEIHKKCFDKPWKKDEFEKLFLNKFNKCLMIIEEEDENVVAAMGFVLFQQIEEEGDAEILTICTLPKFRGTGVAKTLLKKINANKFFLEVREDNLTAINLYEKLGFEVTKKRKSYYGDGTDAFVMIKNNIGIE